MKENESLSKLVSEGRVQCVLKIETRLDGQMWQQVRVNHGEGIFTDEWFHVANINGTTRPRMGRPPKQHNIDWSKVDWDKSGVELAAELNIGQATIGVRRRMYGHPKKGTARFRHMDWASVDWNKGNQQLSGELGIGIHTVAQYRQRCGHPSSAYIARIITPEMIEAVDWERTRDQTISKLWGVSRERVRQIRLQEQKPRCILKTTDTRTQEMEKWLLDNRSSLEGKLASIVAKQCPIDMDLPRKFRAMKAVDIQFTWMSSKRSTASCLNVNWEIPNTLINLIWNKNDNWAGSNRNRLCKPKSPYKHNPFGSGGWAVGVSRLTKLRAAIAEEIKKAQALGITPRFKELKRYGIDVS